MNNKRELINKIREILKGIDECECEHKDGWWETSSCESFGAEKLAEVIAAIESH